jgi:hypothetical protein
MKQSRKVDQRLRASGSPTLRPPAGSSSLPTETPESILGMRRKREESTYSLDAVERLVGLHEDRGQRGRRDVIGDQRFRF